MRDGRGGYRSGDRPDDDYWPDETYRPADDYGSDGQYATYGPRGGTPGTARPRGSGDLPGAGPAASSVNGRDMSSRDVSGRDVSGRDVSGRDVSGRDVSGRDVSGRDPGRRVNSGPQPPMPQWQDRHRASAPAGAGEAALAGAEFGPQAGTGGSPAASPARPYGRILIFTLLEDRVADFDRLAEQAAEEVRTGEPDTLVYVIHLVPNAPLQRIFYEIYRDRAAFESHESQPYMQRFVAERRTCVLATNVIELRLKYAKVAPLPNPQASAPVPPGLPAGPPATRAQSPPGPPPRPQPAPPGRPAGTRGLPVPAGPGASGLGASGLGASGPQPAQRLQPLPPVRPQRPDQRRPDQPRPDQPRPDQQRPDQQRPDQQRPDQQRPDQRQVPSGRHYRG